MSDPKHRTITVEPAMVVITPYACARFSHHMFSMAEAYADDGGSYLARLYLFCVSIELGIKSALLAIDCNAASKARMRGMGHNLERLMDAFANETGLKLFNPDDAEAVAAINGYFKGKGLEYFTPDVLGAAMRAYSDLPSIESIKAAASKLHLHLQENDFFIEATTTELPRGGILNFH